MPNKLSGRKVAKHREGLLKDSGKSPKLVVLSAGDDPASMTYIHMKWKCAERVGIEMEHLIVSDYKELLTQLWYHNQCQETDGIIVQLPLPKGYGKFTINPDKDVDGFNSDFTACTPLGIMNLLDYYDVPISGKKAVVVGRSNIVGKPVADLLLKQNATLTICHSKTEDLKAEIERADIVIAAAGVPELIDGNWFKEGAVVVDVGIHRVDGGLVGDVKHVEKEYSYTPVPGGVGPMTVVSLMENVFKAWNKTKG